MAIKLDERKLKQELIEVYQKFIENRYDKENFERMSELDRKYSGAHDLIYSTAVNRAINNLSFMWQKELPDRKDHLDEAKKILQDLKKIK